MYYLWRLMGYSVDELTYLNVKEVQNLITEVADNREVQRAETIVTRSKKTGDNVTLKTKFKDELNDALKKRYLNIQGLDGSVAVETAAAPQSESLSLSSA